MSLQRRIFISYARDDGEDFATHLRQRLVTVFGEEQLWQDWARMEGGVGWWKQIANALDEVEFMVLVATPAAMASPVVAREWRYARQQGVCVYPVQVPGLHMDFTTLPRWMRDSHFYNLDKEWDTFIAYLHAPCQAVKVPFHGVPDKPENFVERPKEFDALKTKLLDADRQNPVAITTALQGAGGFGKTTLATALCHDEEVQTAFDDGVLWVTLGENPNLVNLYTSLYDALTGERIAFTDSDDASSKFAEKLADKDCLLVIDDVWNASHLRPFLRKAVGGEDRTARLVTTRLLDIAISTGSKPVEVDEMTTDQATAMLATGLSENYDKAGFRDLAQRLGEWPLMLEIANGMVRERVALNSSSAQALEWVNKTLDRRGVRGIRRDNESERKRDAAGVLTASIGLLTVDEAQRLKELSIFKDDLDIPLRALMALWNLDDFDTEEILSRLARAGLVRFNAGSGTLRLHDVIRAYLIEQLGSEWRATHKKLTDNWGDAYQLPDSFVWHWYIHHLCLSGQVDTAINYLLDYRWLSTKLNRADMDVNALLTDCDELLTSLTADNEPKTAVRLVRSALSLSAHVLANHKDQLAMQLAGRLYAHREKAGIALLFQSIKPRLGTFWPIHMTSTHQPAGGSLLRILDGHVKQVLGAMALPNGAFLSWSADNTLRLWDKDGQPLSVLKGHTDWVNGALVLPDSRLLSWSGDGTLRLWDRDGKPSAVFKGHIHSVTGAIALADGRLLSWSEDSTLGLWDEDGQPLSVLEGHMNEVTGALALADGRLLSWSLDGSLRLWNKDGVPLVVLEGHMDEVTGALALADGRFLSWSEDSTLGLWDEDGQPLSVLKGHTDWVNGALALADGRLLSWSADNTLRLWDEDGQPLSMLEGHTSWLNGALELADGRLLSWSADNTLRLWDEDGQPLSVLKGHTDWVNGALALADGRLLSWSEDHTLRIWDEDGEPLAVLQGHIYGVTGALALMDDLILSWSGDIFSMESKLQLWDAKGQGLQVFIGHLDKVTNISILLDNRMLSLSFDGTLQLWDKDRRSLTMLKGHTSKVNGALELSDGRLLSWSGDHTLRLWDRDGQPLTMLKGHTSDVNGALELSDGRLLSWSGDHTLRLWDRDGQPLSVLEGHKSWIDNVSMLDDGRLLSQSHDSTMRLWDTNGQQLAVLEGHTTRIQGVLRLVNNRFLSWSDDKTLRLWDTNGQLVVIFEGHTSRVNGALALADGCILTWSGDKTLRLWDANGQLLTVLEGHTDAVLGALTLSNDWIISWSGDKTLRLWDINGQLLTVLNGHTGLVSGVLALEDGHLLSWSNDNTLRLWDKNGQLAVLEGHTRLVSGALVLMDGRIVSWSIDLTLRLWDKYGNLIASFYGDAPVTCCIVLNELPLEIAIGDEQGRVIFLKLIE